MITLIIDFIIDCLFCHFCLLIGFLILPNQYLSGDEDTVPVRGNDDRMGSF